jgi:hypothetical protein
MKSLFEPDAYAEIASRLEKLSPTATAKWGTMANAQMLAHGCAALEMALGDRVGKKTFIGSLIGPLFKNVILSDKPYGPGAPTSPDFVIKEQKDFSSEKSKLLKLLERFHQGGPENAPKAAHPFFGKLTSHEWGVSQYKHLDHHLRQFGA